MFLKGSNTFDRIGKALKWQGNEFIANLKVNIRTSASKMISNHPELFIYSLLIYGPHLTNPYDIRTPHRVVKQLT